jgi:hypothetical protein
MKSPGKGNDVDRRFRHGSDVPNAQTPPPTGIPPHVQLIQMDVAIWTARAVDLPETEQHARDCSSSRPCYPTAICAITASPWIFQCLRSLAVSSAVKTNLPRYSQSGFTLGCVHPTATHQSIIEAFPI